MSYRAKRDWVTAQREIELPRKERLSYRASLRSLGAELEGEDGDGGSVQVHKTMHVLNRYVDKDESSSPFMFSLCACVADEGIAVKISALEGVKV